MQPGLAEELAVAWRALPHKTLLFCLIAAWCVLFQFLGNSTFGYIDTSSLFGWVNYAYAQSHDDEIGRYVPLLFLGFCWWKRDELVAAARGPWAGGILLVAVALGLHLVGFAVQQARLSAVAFFVGLYGLLGAAWGFRFLRAVFFPYFLFVFAVPLGTLADTITLPLRMVATSLTTWITTGLGVSLIQDGTRIFDPKGSFQFEVAAACGGLRSLTATVALAAIYAFVAVERPGRRLLMIASALPLAVAGNVFRLTLIIIAAEAFGQRGGDWVHEDPRMSLLPYIPVFVGLGVLGSWLRKKPEHPHAEIPVPRPA